MTARRPPTQIALEILECVEEKGQCNKWDLIKILGNETQFRVWIEDFFLTEKIIEERKEGRNYFYTKTKRGEQLHKLLCSGNLINLFGRLSGKKLRK